MLADATSPNRPAADNRQRALHHPPAGQHYEAFHDVFALDGLRGEAQFLTAPADKGAGATPVSPDQGDFPDPSTQPVVELRDQPVLPPPAEEGMAPAPGREVRGHRTPGNPARHQVTDRIERWQQPSGCPPLPSSQADTGISGRTAAQRLLELLGSVRTSDPPRGPAFMRLPPEEHPGGKPVRLARSMTA